ncbi:33647_t:CDS:1 [Gigaspora margarita]|uniref:33647_t:CDS:1 n=1 Tax=Gigaspora margarita TaxID=4874 RepID=A0ABM8VXL7_GIGMA|nr:33647_t:CDS:1 [Gigaspora margarita]
MSFLALTAAEEFIGTSLSFGLPVQSRKVRVSAARLIEPAAAVLAAPSNDTPAQLIIPEIAAPPALNARVPTAIAIHLANAPSEGFKSSFSIQSKLRYSKD